MPLVLLSEDGVNKALALPAANIILVFFERFGDVTVVRAVRVDTDDPIAVL